MRGPGGWALAALGVSVLGAACTARLLTRFPHQQHLARLDCGAPGQPDCLSCTTCHAGASEQAATWKKPPPSVCEGCHRPDEPRYAYARSIRPANAPRPAAYEVRFDHDAHLLMPQIKGQCLECHAGAVGTAQSKPLFPPMATCTGCHEHRAEFEANACGRCHPSSALRGLRPVSFLPHDERWIRRHAVQARGAPAQCGTCHAQAQCDGCHDATQSLRAELKRPDAVGADFVHRFDYLSRHGIEARSQPAQCASCHQKQDCDACHVRHGVSGGAVDARSPHPLGWAIGLGPETNLHAKAARRDIWSCAACHDQGAATNCVRCHAVGGFGGSPHPPGWRSTRSVSEGGCAECHGGAL